MEIADSIQPRFQANIYTQENPEMQFPKHTRRLIKDAKQRGVETYRASQSELHKFSKIVSLTEKRKIFLCVTKLTFKVDDYLWG